jgi:hypothetical protein
LTPFPTGDISFARDKVSNLQYRAQRILEEPVVEKPDFRLFKKVQCEARKDKDESGRMKTENSAFSFHKSSVLMRWAFFTSLLTLALYGGTPCQC